ncbi:MAG: HTH domain-containing protein [Candidatus Doudnabacteria bacterium]
MSKRIFTKEQIEMLLKNPNVERCSEKSITYRKNFKVFAIKQYHEGLSPKLIFAQAGFNIALIGLKNPKWCLHSWRRVCKNKGVGELSIETRGRSKAGGRPKTNWQNDKEKIKYLEARVAYLKAENDFLAKLRKKS